MLNAERYDLCPFFLRCLSSLGHIDLSLGATALAVGDSVNVYGITPDSDALPLAPCAARITSDDGENGGDNGGDDSGDTPTEPDYILGDTNGDSSVDSADVLLVKRAILNNYLLSLEEKQRADINSDSKITFLDYLLVKRITSGTYQA